MTLPFTREEYHDRLVRVRQAMDREELDVLLIFHQEHMYYLTGYDQVGYWVYQVLIVPRDGQLTYVVRRVDELLVRQSRLVEDIRIWLDDALVDPTEMTANVLRERGLLSGKRIGIEKKSHALLPYYYDQLREHLGSAVLIDASDLITEIRLTKSPAEIDYMRRAGQILDQAMAAGFGALREGVREFEIHAAVVHAMYSMGGGPPAVAPPLASGPGVLSQTHSAAGDRALQQDDLFMLEVGAQHRRYHAVGVRTGCLGTPHPTLLSMHEAAVEATDVGLKTIAAGVPTAEVAQRVHAVLETSGFSRRGSHVGYGIGLGYPPTWIDTLRIKETDPHILAPGMTFMLHVILTNADAQIAAACGDPVLVTENGCRLLSEFPRELITK